MSARLVFALFSTALVLNQLTWASGREQDDCYKEQKWIPHQGKSLTGHVLETVQSDSTIDCALSCTSNDMCYSYNYHNGTKVCELNRSNKTTDPASYGERDGYTYYQPPMDAFIMRFGDSFQMVFTTLGSFGRLGPTTLGTHYQGQPHDGQVTLSSGIQLWTVPVVGYYKIQAIGASGGYDKYNSDSINYRGYGARMTGIFTLNQGEIIKILVGQAGITNAVSNSAGGGGGSFVVRGTDTPLIIAGGGGGIEAASGRQAVCDANATTAGNRGHGGLQWSGGTGGHGASIADSGNSGGGGGGFYSNGRSSSQYGGSGTGGEGGRGFLQGGAGGQAYTNNIYGGFGGGGGAYGGGGGAGGGGGYSGGASGDNVYGSCGGGGGSYNSGTDKTNECCYNSAGHGKVIITKLEVIG